jgi:sugar fermentation stimulation protein A
VNGTSTTAGISTAPSRARPALVPLADRAGPCPLRHPSVLLPRPLVPVVLAVLQRRGPRRRTAGTLLLVRHRGRWVGVDARLPNRLFEAAMRAGALRAFRRYARWRPEVQLGRGRVDFLLMGRDGVCLAETKSCNRVDGTVALFPDVPTPRGTRHLEDLARAARRGGRAAALGVRFYAYTCRVTPRRVTLLRRIPVRLGAVHRSDGANPADG